MKKLVSILVVLAMAFALSAVPAFAADLNFTLSTEKTTFNAGDEFDLTIEAGSCATWGIIVSFDEDLFEIIWDSENDDYLYDTGAHTGALVMNPNGAADCFSIGGMRTKNGSVSATVSIKVKDNAPSGKFTFTAVSAGEKSTAKADGTLLNAVIEDSEELTIVGSAPQVETVEMAAPAYMTEATLSEETSGWQVGQGVALKFTVADLAEFDAMNWKLTCANIGTKYAKVADEDFAAIKASSAETIDVFASFIVNSKDAKETVNAITAVGAGFKKADGTVVETK